MGAPFVRRPVQRRIRRLPDRCRLTTSPRSRPNFRNNSHLSKRPKSGLKPRTAYDFQLIEDGLSAALEEVRRLKAELSDD